MARSKRQRRRDRREAINAGETRQVGGVAEELREEADQGIRGEVGHDDSTLPNPPGRPILTAADVSMTADQREEFDRGLDEAMAEDERHRGEQENRKIEAGELIEALGVLRESRANPLTAGIQVFTAMLEQARAGYAADRLAEIEAAMLLDFNALEAQGIVQIAMANMDETGVPDVEQGVQLCIQARVEAARVNAEVEADRGSELSQVDLAETYVASTPWGERLEGEGADRNDVEAADQEYREEAQRELQQERDEEVAESLKHDDHAALAEQEEEDDERERIEAEEAEADKPGPED